MTSKIAIWKEELGQHKRWWVGLTLALVGGILGIHFGFAGNSHVMSAFAAMFVLGLWLR